MRVGILGAGFGLYGYLPALISGCGARVMLPERYRAHLQSRDDIRHFDAAVEWIVDEETLLASADAIMVSRRPEDQVRWVSNSQAYPNIKRVLLEKPIAPTPEAAMQLLDSLHERGMIVRVGYTLRYPQWGQALLAWCAGLGKSPLNITWKFQAHHYRFGLSNWKRTAAAGGGALRFYGIQLIALLAEMGYESASESVVSADRIDEAERWSAVFYAPTLPDCRVEIDTNSATDIFSIRSLTPKRGDWQDVLLQDPFATDNARSGIDRRVPVLTALCRELLHGDVCAPAWYRKSLDLWSEVERVTRCVTLGKSGSV